MQEPDKIVVAVGGGGLLCGILEGMKRNEWFNAQVITAKTEGAASFAKSLKAGKVVELDEIQTIATSLGAKKVAKQSIEYASSFNIKPYIASDKEAFTACEEFFDEYLTLVEPACGAAISYALSPKMK